MTTTDIDVRRVEDSSLAERAARDRLKRAVEVRCWAHVGWERDFTALRAPSKREGSPLEPGL